MSAREAVQRGLGFLRERQRADGGFRVDVSNVWLYGPEPVESHSSFATALIGRSLGAVDDAAAREMGRRAAVYLLGQRRAGGVWGFFLPADKLTRRAAPLDVDDTACVALLLEDHALPFDDVRPVLLANRDREGRVFTWLIAHRGCRPPRSLRFWQAALVGLRAPRLRFGFWRITPSEPGDVDAGVNANVLLHLGDGPHAPAITEYLSEVVRNGRETTADKWYQGFEAMHYCIARVHAAGIPGLEAVAPVATARLLERVEPGGRIGADAATTALGLCALRSWGHAGPELDAAAGWLVSEQLASGAWPAGPVFHGGDSSWGSPELTTGLCLEALAPGA